MISQTESGLSQADYEALLAATTRPNYSVIAHRWNPDFGTAAWVTGSQSNVGDDWDAVADDQYLYRVWGRGTTDFGFQRVNLTTGVIDAELTSASRPSDTRVNTRYRVSLSDTPGTIYLYANTDLAIYRRPLTDYGSTPSPWSLLLSDASNPSRQSANQFFNGTADASTFEDYEYSDYTADSAFDNNKRTFWQTQLGTATGWLRYHLPSAKVLTAYSMYCTGIGAPKSWTFQGSNDGSAWTTLDTQAAVADWSSETRVYSFSNTTAYEYYRVNVTAVQSGISAVLIHELNGYYYEDISSFDDFAVPHWQYIHFTHFEEDIGTYNLRLAQYGSPWTITNSDIHLTFRPEALEAVSFIKDADAVVTNRRIHVVTLNTEVPGIEKIVAEDNTPVRYITTSKGLISFWVRYSESSPTYYTWSEHFEVDLISETNASNFRNYARMGLIDDQIYLTTYSSDGVSQYTNLGCRYYSSKQGRYWSLGNILPLDAGEYGIKLVQQGDYLLAVERSKIWRSYSTLQFGHSPTALQLDLTPYMMEYNTDNSSMFSANFSLGNDTGLFTDHDWFNNENVIALVHRTGYYIGTGFLDYPVGITEVDTLDFSEQVPEQMVRVSSRDHLGWMTDKFKSENAKYWNSLRVAGDNYLDKTGTNYGGLSHTAIQDGRWETVDGVLICKSDNANASPSGEGIVFASDPSNIWNGVVEVGFKLQDESHARAGVIFRAYDVYNYWEVYYHPTDDEIVLLEHHGYDGNLDDGETYVSGNPGWTNTATQWHYLRVRFYHGLITVWYSADGITWTHNFDYTVVPSIRQSASPYLKKLDHVVKERGYVGLTAQTMPTTETQFSNFKAYEIGNLHIVENAFQAYAALAGIHDTQFDELDYSTDVANDWTYNAATFEYGSQSGLSSYPGFTLGSDSGWQYALHDIPLLTHNLVVKTRIFLNGVSFGIVVRALEDGTFLIAGRDTSGYPVIVSFDGASTFTTVYQGGFALLGGEVTVAFQEINTGSDSDTFWHVVSMWWNDKLVAVYIEDYGSTPISGAIKWGFAGNNTAVFFETPRLPELNVISDWTTLDPGEAPMSALSRAIEGLNLRFFVRYDGRLYAWKPKAKTSVFTYANKSRMSHYTNGFDQRKIRTAIRVVGGYAEATYHDKDLIKKYEYRFAEVNNPFILTHDESYREAQLVLMRMLEQATQTEFSHPHTAFLEPEDRVGTPSGDRLVTGIGIQYTGPIHNQQLALRGYPYGEPE